MVFNCFQVILSHATHLYLDFPIEPDPEERGLYWATRTIPMKTLFSFQPDYVYNNIETDRMGNTLNKTEICDMYGCPALTEPQNVIGIYLVGFCRREQGIIADSLLRPTQSFVPD